MKFRNRSMPDDDSEMICSPPPARDGRRRGAFAGALVASGIVLAAGSLGQPVVAFVQSGALSATYALCAVAVFGAGRSRPHRSAALLMATAFGAWAVGFALWLDVDGHIVTSTSWADAAFLAYYPLAVAGIVVRLRATAPGRAGYVWIDGGVATLGTATLGSLLLAGTADKATALTALAYPSLDLVLLSAVCGAIVVQGRRDRSITVLGLGAAVLALSDVHYAVGLVGGGYDIGSPLGAGWAVGGVLMAWSLTMETVPTRLERPRSSAAVPAFFTFVSLVILALPGSFGTGTSLLAVGTTALCLVRMLLTERDLSGLLLARHEARTDELTGLANRRHLNAALQSIVDVDDVPTCVMMMDLDRFKEVNDILGHEAGDRVLQMLAERLEPLVPEGSMLARFGGDEFVWLLRGTAAAEARALTTSIFDALRVPFDLGIAVIDLDASIGLVEFPRHGDEAATLLRHADIAMYHAKAERSGLVEYDESFDPVLTGEYQLAAEIRRVSFAEEFVVRFQPLVSVATRSLAGAEALVRWQHPRLGLLAPDLFLDALMEAGRGTALTEWVTEVALEACASWRNTHPDVFVAINLCADDLVDPDLVDRLDAAVCRHGLPRSALHLEVPETLATADRTSTNDAVKRLGAVGYVVALDDFGTGTSSLSQLRELGPSEVKVDKSFGMTAPRDPTAATILRATVELGHNLGMSVTVEGVDNHDTLELLQSIGCDVAQGYLLATPLPADEVAAWSWDGRISLGRDTNGLDPVTFATVGAVRV